MSSLLTVPTPKSTFLLRGLKRARKITLWKEKPSLPLGDPQAYLCRAGWWATLNFCLPFQFKLTTMRGSGAEGLVMHE